VCLFLQTFVWLKGSNWKVKRVEAVAAALRDGFFAHPQPNGVRLHVADLLTDELLAAAEGACLPPQALLSALDPLLLGLAIESDRTFFNRALAAVVGSLSDKASDHPGLVALQARVFEIAAAESTLDRYRKDFYSAQKSFQGLTGQKPVLLEESPSAMEQENGEEVAVIKAKSTKKKKVAESRMEDPEEVASVAHKSKKTKKVRGGVDGKLAASEAEAAQKKAGASKEQEKPVDKSAKKKKRKVADEASALAAEPLETPGKRNKRVSFGKNSSRDHGASIKALKASAPQMPASPAKGILSAKKGKEATTPLTPRRKASEFF